MLVIVLALVNYISIFNISVILMILTFRGLSRMIIFAKWWCWFVDVLYTTTTSDTVIEIQQPMQLILHLIEIQHI